MKTSSFALRVMRRVSEFNFIESPLTVNDNEQRLNVAISWVSSDSKNFFESFSKELKRDSKLVPLMNAPANITSNMPQNVLINVFSYFSQSRITSMLVKRFGEWIYSPLCYFSSFGWIFTFYEQKLFSFMQIAIFAV